MAPKHHAVNNSSSGPTRGGRCVVLLFVLVCIAAAVYFTTLLDIGLYDETAYLDRGLRIPSDGLPTADMAPLYSLWYFVLHGLVQDPIDLYQVHLTMTIAALPVLCLLLLRALGTAWMPSLIASAVALVSTFNVLSWPRVSAFALILLIGGWLLHALAKDRNRGLAYLIVFTSITVFIRPEFILSLGLLTVWWLWSLLRENGMRTAVRIKRIAWVAALLLASRLFLGDPLANGRGIIAFGQHYALNKVEADGSAMDPWTNWEAILQADFGPVDGIVAAAGAEPGCMIWHVAQNIKAIPKALARSVLPASVRTNPYMLLGLTLLCMVLAVRAYHNWKLDRARMSEVILVGVILFSPAVASMIVFHPREHYVLFPVCLGGLALMACAFPRKTTDHVPFRSFGIVIGAAALLVPLLGQRLEHGSRPVLSTIEALRELPLRPGATLLDADGGYGVYLNIPTQRIQAQEKDTLFAFWSQRVAPDVIIASPRLLTDHRYRGDPSWQTFLKGGYGETYERRTVAGTQVRLFLFRQREH